MLRSKNMLHTNRGELCRLFDTFCRVWGAGGDATFTTSTQEGKLRVNLDIQLGSATAACPGAPTLRHQRPSAWTSTAPTSASGHPGAGQRCRRRRHRGPAAKARSNARAAAHQAFLATAKASPASVLAPPPLGEGYREEGRLPVLFLATGWRGRQRGRDQKGVQK